MARDYLVNDRALIWDMAMWLQYIELFEWQYNKDFTLNTFFGFYIVNQIHNRFQLFLHSCNITCLYDVEKGALSDFGDLHRRVERGEWITSTPIWVEFPIDKEDRRRKS